MSNTYKLLTDYIPQIERAVYGKWMPDHQTGDGSPDHPYQMPYVEYGRKINALEDAIYQFINDHPEYELNNYNDILKRNHIEWGLKSMASVDVSHMDGQLIMALFVGAVRAERFCDGAMLSFLENGSIQKWLKRLRELDEE